MNLSQRLDGLYQYHEHVRRMTQNHAFPPLIGDEEGRFRIRIVGNSGSGKARLFPRYRNKTTGHVFVCLQTTLCKELASILNIPALSLDELHWQPGWKETPADELREKVEDFIQQNASRGWVIDGNYSKKGGLIVQERATDVIWLNPPLLLYFPRIIIRTLLRLMRLRPPCRPGCNERFREVFFSKDSIIWWCLTNHRSSFERNSALMEIWGLGVGSRAQKMRRLGGWGAELRDWLKSVRELARNR